MQLRKRPTRFAALITLLVGIISMSAIAASMDWREVRTVRGVTFKWRYVQELRDQYRSETAIINNTANKIEVRFNVKFTQGTKTKYDIGGSFILEPYGKRGGQWDGQSYYPFEGKKPPTQIEIVDIRIKTLE